MKDGRDEKERRKEGENKLYQLTSKNKTPKLMEMPIA